MYSIKNIKLSVKLNFHSFLTLTESLKHITKFNNYIVLKDKFTFILFKPRNHSTISHLNITKVKSFSCISEACDLAEEIFKGQILRETLQIDNITATHYLNTIVDLRQLYSKYSQHFTLRYNNDVFPGLHWKSEKGTAIIFHTGNVIIVGCKKEQEISVIVNQVRKWTQIANTN